MNSIILPLFMNLEEYLLGWWCIRLIVHLSIYIAIVANTEKLHKVIQSRIVGIISGEYILALDNYVCLFLLS